MLYRRRHFVATSLAFLALGFSAPALSERASNSSDAQGSRTGGGGGRGRGDSQGGGDRGGGDRQRGGRTGARGNRSKKKNCDDAGKAPVRLVIKGKEAWRGDLRAFFDQPGAVKGKGKKRAELRAIPLAALVANSGRRWREISVIACNGEKKALSARILAKTPKRYIIVETRRNFLKLVEARKNFGEITLLRDIRTIEMD